MAKNMASNIFKSFYRHNSDTKLQDLAICFVCGSNVVCDLVFTKKHDLETKEISALCRNISFDGRLISTVVRYSNDAKEVSPLIHAYNTWCLI